MKSASQLGLLAVVVLFTNISIHVERRWTVGYVSTFKAGASQDTVQTTVGEPTNTNDTAANASSHDNSNPIDHVGTVGKTKSGLSTNRIHETKLNATGMTGTVPTLMEQDDRDALEGETPLLNDTTNHTNSSRSYNSPRDFSHMSNAAIVTKIHGDESFPRLFWSFCLLNSAYNSRVKHDIFIFHTEPLNENKTLEFQSIMAPAKVTFVLDERTLEQQVDSMTPEQRDELIERCDGVNTTAQLNWTVHCRGGMVSASLAYCWMAEFRSRFLWNHTVLQDYRYMMWVDTDALCMKKWEQDPIAFLARNNLVLLQGANGGIQRAWTGVQHRIRKAYNKTLCGVMHNETSGTYVAAYGGSECENKKVVQTHGYFHVIDLDFYRLPINLEWSNTMMNGTRFSRLWDDQLAVKVPAVMLGPDRMMDMVKSGLDLGVMHHGRVMENVPYPGRYRSFWYTEAATAFPDAVTVCQGYYH